MKVVHFESGLGNQMLDYVDYLLIQRANPKDDIYIEKIIYDIPECHNVISMWNGYELDHIFGISLPDIKEVFSDDVWKNILSLMVKSEFWNKNWNYSEAIIYAFSQNGLQLQNKIVRKIPFSNKINWKNKIKMYLKNTEITGYMQYWIGNINKKVGKNLNIYNYSEENIYCGHSLMGMFEGYGIENVENDVKKIFAFPNFTDFKNIEFSKFL